MNYYFENILGNDQIKKYLSHMITKERVGQSYLFAGTEGIGKGLFALALAKILISQSDPNGYHLAKIEKGNHPDIRIYRPEGKIGMHSIDSMRQFSQEVYLPPYEAKWKIFIIHDAERMLPYSSNALLKTFEEPAQDSLIILLSSAPEELLPTVLSRCRRVIFQPVAQKAIADWLEKTQNAEKDKAWHIAGLSQGSVAQALRLLQQGREPAHDLLLKTLSKGKLSTYGELKQFALELATKAEQTRDVLESTLRKEIFKGAEEDLSSSQKELLEKELEGALTMRYRDTVDGLLQVILSWFRDIILLQSRADTRLLVHRDYESDLEQALQRGEMRSLEEVQKAIDAARLAVDRFIPLSSTIESLFLKLNFL
jgi:DNA polymerase-3 subunit delta'